MPERWAVELVEALRGQAIAAENKLVFAMVQTVKPLTILINGQLLSKQLYRNASLSLEPGDEILVYQVNAVFYILLKVVPV